MLIHFPIALIPVSFGFDLIGFLKSNQELAFSGFILLTIAMGGGVLSLFFGLADFLKIPTKSESFRVALLHGGLSTTWLMTWAVLWGIRIRHYPDILVTNNIYLVVLGLTMAGMIISNYLGGELVLKYNIGKLSINKN